MSLQLQSEKRWIFGFVLVGFFDLVCGFYLVYFVIPVDFFDLIGRECARVFVW